MNCWNYKEGVPQVPVRLVGKTIVEELGLIDSGAAYCVVHPRIADAMKLEFTGTRSVYGLGSKKSMCVDTVEIELEVGDFREKTEVVCIKKEHYPPNAPEVIIGRSFMNKYAFILDGERVCIEDKKILKEKLRE